MVNHHVLWNMTNGSVITVHPKIPLCHRIEYKQIKHNYVLKSLKAIENLFTLTLYVFSITYADTFKI